MRSDFCCAIQRLAKTGIALSFLASALQAATLRITSPTDGAVVYSGRTFVVTVEAAGVFGRVAVIADHPIEDPGSLYTPPYRFTLRIPATTISGVHYLQANGTTATGEERRGEPISVDVERPDPPVKVTTFLSTLTEGYVGRTSRLPVTGVYADGSRVELTHSSLTSYSSDSPEVATVDKTGLVTATGPGAAKITITNNGASVVVPVEVANRRSS